MSQAQKVQLVICFALLSLVLTNTGTAEARRNKATPNSVPVYALSAADKQHVLQDDFVTVHTVQAIPKPVLSEMVEKMKVLFGMPELNGIANPGQPFLNGDVIDKPLPMRRLVFAASSPGYCLVYYEQGGYAPHNEVSIYRLLNTQAILIWRATIQEASPCQTLLGLQSEIAEGKFYSERIQQAAHKS